MTLFGCIPGGRAASRKSSDENKKGTHNMSPFFVFTEQIKAEHKNLTLGSWLRHPFRYTAK